MGLPRVSNRWLWAGLLAAVCGALAVVVLPAVLIFPFRPQTPSGIALSFELRRGAPVATAVLFGLQLLLALALAFRRRRPWPLAALGVSLLLGGGAAWFARQNHFEWMFQPLHDPAYGKVGDVGWLADGDMVIAVEIAGDAVAYPVREMAYHHVVNTTVGGRAVVSTY